MRLFDDIPRDLREAYPCGRIGRDGEAVGVWYVCQVAGSDAKVARLWRDADGRPCGESVWGSPGEGMAASGRVQGSFGRDLGFHLHDLLANVGTVTAAVRDEVDLARNAGETLRRWHRRMSREEAEEQARVTLWPALREAADPFLSGLDPDAMELFLAYPDQRWWLGEHWVDIDDTAGDAPLAAALMAHPGFPRAVCQVMDVAGRDGMAKALARGRLWDMVVAWSAKRGATFRTMDVARRAEAAMAAKASPYPVIAARRPRPEGPTLQGLFAPGARDDEWPVTVARWAERFPPDWEPTTRGGWWAFARIVPVMQAVEAEYGGDTRFDRLLPSGGDWEAMLSRLVSATDRGRRPGTGPRTERETVDSLVRAALDVRDMAAAYAAQVLVPALAAGDAAHSPADVATRHARRAALSVLAGGRSLARALELSADWHRRNGSMAAAVATLPGAFAARLSWRAGLPDAARGDVAVRVLTDTVALAAEGGRGPDAHGVDGLDNCLAGYGEECLSGLVRIVSLRRLGGDGTWARLSAAELSLTSTQPFRVLQHAGAGNGPAPAEAEEALLSYLDGLRSGATPHDASAFAPVAVPDIPAHVRACGFDPAVEGTRVAVARMWDRYVPRPLRGLDAAAAEAVLATAGGRGWPAAAPLRPGAGATRSPAHAPSSRLASGHGTVRVTGDG